MKTIKNKEELEHEAWRIILIITDNSIRGSLPTEGEVRSLVIEIKKWNKCYKDISADNIIKNYL